MAIFFIVSFTSIKQCNESQVIMQGHLNNSKIILVLALTSLWPQEAAARPFPQLSRSKGRDRGFSWRDSRQKFSSGHSHFLMESAVCTPEASG